MCVEVFAAVCCGEVSLESLTPHVGQALTDGEGTMRGNKVHGRGGIIIQWEGEE